MTFVSVTEFETRLQWRCGRTALLSGDEGPSIPVGAGLQSASQGSEWHPESLLVGAVEGRTLLAFLEQATAAGVEILFYQSSAVARRVDRPSGAPHYTDLIVRPHVAVRSETDADTVRRIFEELPERCFPSSMLRITPRIEPIIDAWDAQHEMAWEEDERRGGERPRRVRRGDPSAQRSEH